jgi:stearoyl-CoA desaturase (delta-9 desaturase)
MAVVEGAQREKPAGRLKWTRLVWWISLHVGALLAPFYFSWSGLVLCLTLYVMGSMGITLAYHRLLTHRSFQTPRVIEHILTFFGVLANQGGPLQWVATHRVHHKHSDHEGDPHTPRDGTFWAHALWWMTVNESLERLSENRRYVMDLAKDPIHRFYERFNFAIPVLIGVLLYPAGQWWGGLGVSWVLWGFFLRTAVVYNATHFVNSATHKWGYRNFVTRDDSTNLWWVALVSFGEGWHNNHHAFPRSARHGMRWWEFDATFLAIKVLSFLRMARHIHVPGAILRPVTKPSACAVEEASSSEAAAIPDNLSLSPKLAPSVS